LVPYKKGDYVDVIADGAVQRGMPHKFYHGKTGRVFNITKHAIGVIVNKRVGNRIIPKRIHVRTEHVRMSNSREAFKNRVRENDKKKREAKAAGTRVDIKRKAVQQRESQLIKTSDTEIEFMNPIKFRELY
jgi:large subunit ribosomal protein L21e